MSMGRRGGSCSPGRCWRVTHDDRAVGTMTTRTEQWPPDCIPRIRRPHVFPAADTASVTTSVTTPEAETPEGRTTGPRNEVRGPSRARETKKCLLLGCPRTCQESSRRHQGCHPDDAEVTWRPRRRRRVTSTSIGPDTPIGRRPTPTHLGVKTRVESWAHPGEVLQVTQEQSELAPFTNPGERAPRCHSPERGAVQKLPAPEEGRP
jgi:hypothetical protein